MVLIDAGELYRKFLDRYAADVGSVGLAEKTRHALLVGFYTAFHRTRNYGLCPALRHLKKPYPFHVFHLPMVKKNKLKFLWMNVGNLMCAIYRTKNADDLLEGTRRFEKVLKQGWEREIERAKQLKEADQPGPKISHGRNRQEK
jgi:hypothetical protein